MPTKCQSYKIKNIVKLQKKIASLLISSFDVTDGNTCLTNVLAYQCKSVSFIELVPWAIHMSLFCSQMFL